MGSMLPYIAAPWIRHGISVTEPQPPAPLPPPVLRRSWDRSPNGGGPSAAPPRPPSEITRETNGPPWWWTKIIVQRKKDEPWNFSIIQVCDIYIYVWLYMYICTCSFSECSYFDVITCFLTWSSLCFFGIRHFFLLINDVTVNGFC